MADWLSRVSATPRTDEYGGHNHVATVLASNASRCLPQSTETDRDAGSSPADQQTAHQVKLHLEQLQIMLHSATL